MIGRHPRGVEIGAWFDGEGSERVGAHLVECRRCRRRADDMAEVRAWLRGSSWVAMTDRPAAPAARTRSPGRRTLVPATLLVLAALLWPLDSRRHPTPPESELAGGPPAHQVEGPAPPAAPEVPVVDLMPPRQAVEETPSVQPAGQADERTGEAASAGAVAPPPRSRSNPLRLGLVVPTSGLRSGEGAEIREAVQVAVATANAAGGVGGQPVELLLASAEDPSAMTTLKRRGVTALVGGFGVPAPADLPWLLPADPSVTGPLVLAAEPSPHTAGVQLATVLRRLGLDGPIGVVVGEGPEAGLASGVASRALTIPVVATTPDGCDREVAMLQRSGAVALAVAAGPDLAGRCLQAARRLGWSPRFGALVPPSAAYARLDVLPHAAGARTVLALPWPTSNAPGAARFRSTAQSVSYRALLSFAAAELAIEVARSRGVVSLPAVGAGEWRTDLVDFVGTASRSDTVVVAAPSAWLPSR